MNDTNYLPSWLTGLVDEEGGLNFRVNVFPEVYIYLGLTVVISFILGGMILNSLIYNK